MKNLLSLIKNIAFSVISRIDSEENGSGLVETAVILAFALTMTFGIIDVSRAVYTNNVVTAAAQEGARAGIISQDDIQIAVESKMFGLNMANADVQITTNGDIIEVVIVYNFELVTPIASTLLDSLEFDGKASMVASM